MGAPRCARANGAAARRAKTKRVQLRVITDSTETTRSTSLARLVEGYAVAFEGFVVLVQEAGAEIGGAAAVDNGGADDVQPFVQREALGDAVVNYRLAIAIDADDLLAIHPPDRGGIRSNRQADARHFARAVHERDGPEQNVGGRPVQRMSEVIEVQVVEPGVFGVPRELRVADGHLVAIVWNDSELIGEILLLHEGLDGAIREAIGGDGFQHQPALDETIDSGRLVRRGGAH